MKRKMQTLLNGVNGELHCLGVQVEERATIPEFAWDEERANNTVRRREQKAALPESARDEERAAMPNHETIYCMIIKL